MSFSVVSGAIGKGRANWRVHPHAAKRFPPNCALANDSILSRALGAKRRIFFSSSAANRVASIRFARRGRTADAAPRSGFSNSRPRASPAAPTRRRPGRTIPQIHIFRKSFHIYFVLQNLTGARPRPAAPPAPQPGPVRPTAPGSANALSAQRIASRGGRKSGVKVAVDLGKIST